jgi:hypothetical protein
MDNKELRTALISKHLEGWNGLESLSIEHFAKTGKASGSFMLALHDMLEEYRTGLTKQERESNARLFDFLENGGLQAALKPKI